MLCAKNINRQSHNETDVFRAEELTTPLRHILLIHNVIIKNKNFFVSLHWMFTSFIEKSYDGKHLPFGRTLDRRCHFKHVLLKAGSTTNK